MVYPIYFNKYANHKLNKPTLLFIDKDDEFVPLGRLNEIITQNKYDRWQIHLVQKDKAVSEEVSHHLIIDKESVGRRTWRKIEEAMKKHLHAGSFCLNRHGGSSLI